MELFRSWVLAVLLLLVPVAKAQNRGVYPLGMSAINSGMTPQPGFTYANQLLFYSRDKAKDNDGNELEISGSNDVLMDLNTLNWVSEFNLFGNAGYSAAVTIPVAKNQLTSDIHGQISGGSGLADAYFMPLILSWTEERFAIRAIYGVLAPTGKYSAGASDNVGSGYWTHTFSSGQSFYLSEDRKWVLSMFEIYEFHTEQEGTGVHPGQTLSLDASLLSEVSRSESLQVQLGLVGYFQRQTTEKTGPEVTAELKNERYAVNALGAAVNFVYPRPRANLSLRYFKEFANRSTYEGDSIQISGSIAL
ncbi:hypothetical protein D3C87_189430 [compost metagenome]